MIVVGKLALMAAGALGLVSLLGGSSSSSSSSPAKKPGGLTPITPLGKIPPGGDRTPRPKGGGGGAPADGPDPEDPRVDANMPAALKAATIALLDNPNVTVAQLRAGALVAEGGGFQIAAASLNDLADEHEQAGTATAAAISTQQAADAAAVAAGQHLNPGAPITADPATDPAAFAQQMQAQLDAISQAGGAVITPSGPQFSNPGGGAGGAPPSFDPGQAPSGFDTGTQSASNSSDSSDVLGILGF